MNNLSGLPRYVFFSLLLCLVLFVGTIATSPIYAQTKKVKKELKKMRKDKRFPHFFHESWDDLIEKESRRMDLYGFRKGDTIASIGAGWGRWEVAYGAMMDSLVFYLEDINDEMLYPAQLDFNLRYYTLLKGGPVLSDYYIQIGTLEQTNLPSYFFDKVLIINAFHEFSHIDEMIRDINRILKDDGLLLLNEFDAFESGDTHMGCDNRIYTWEEINDMFSDHNFELISSEWDIEPMKKIPGTRIYIFRKKVIKVTP
jgi:ubiquinone/menaquinone biosynthesis C-methylase UbiE